MHHFPHGHAEALDGGESRLRIGLRGLDGGTFVRLDRLGLVGHDRGAWSVDGKDWRLGPVIAQLILEVWGEGAALGVAEAVFSWHGRPSGGGCKGRGER